VVDCTSVVEEEENRRCSLVGTRVKRKGGGNAAARFELIVEAFQEKEKRRGAFFY